MAGNWSITVPNGTTNEIENPSFEVNVTDGWTNIAGALWSRSIFPTPTLFGIAVADDAALDTTMESNAISLAVTETITVSYYVYRFGTASTVSIVVRDTTNNVNRATTNAAALQDQWIRVEASWTNNLGGAANVAMRVITSASDRALFDGMQMEKQSAASTFCDGSQPGCEWNGDPDNSSSTRDARALAGGDLNEFEANYSFYVDRMVGVGAIVPVINIDEFAILPGGELNSKDRPPREFVLGGTITGTSLNDLHDNRQALIKDLIPDAPSNQPVVLTYDGASVDKKITCFYAGGLDASIQAETARIGAKERVAVRFLAPDPNFVEIGNGSVILDTNDTGTLTLVTARLKSTGQWDTLGPPNAAGTYTSVEDIAIGPDKIVYVAGNFLNFDNIAAADRFVSYDPVAAAWGAIGPAGTFANGIVQTIAIAPDGDVYVGGSFTVGGGSVANYLARWDGANWNAVGAPGVVNITIVNDLVFGLDGTLYIGGDFTNWAGIGANAAYIVQWDGAAFTALTTGLDGRVIAMDVAPDGTLYVGGDFADAGGVTVGDLASWDGTAWADVGGGVAGGGDIIGNIVAAKNNLIYIGGSFDTAGGITVNNICIWNGITFTSLDVGTNGLVESLALGPDGVLYAGGSFTTAGGLALADRVGKWAVNAWAHLDLDLPGTPTLEAIAVGAADPIVAQNYDVWLGFTTDGAGSFAGTVSATNDGTVETFPEITISRTGGTSAILEQIRNETTGRELLFNYALLDGETLTIKLEPTEKKIESDYFGARPDALLANSDFGTFSLKPGANDITAFVAVAGGPTVVGALTWLDTYDGLD